jgi:aminoglycoside 3-N-acetyltransferase
MIGRRIYWRNISRFSKKAKKSKINTCLIAHRGDTPLHYGALEQHFRALGVADGSLLVVHSSFAPLKGRVSSPDDVIDFLLRLVGSQGTLAMPATPLFKNSRPVEEYLSSEPDEHVYVYDIQRSRIQTGSLPAALHKRPGSVRSRHPINSMVALGPMAEKLMQDNLSGDSPLACGVNSSWYRCVEHNALIISLGIDLSHSLTMIHVAEDIKEGQWPVKNWYVDKQFLVKDNGFEEFRVLRERAHRWGALHFAERTLCRDLLVAGLLKSHTIDGILIEALSANRLIDFLEMRNRSGYPYFWLPL